MSEWEPFRLQQQRNIFVFTLKIIQMLNVNQRCSFLRGLENSAWN